MADREWENTEWDDDAESVGETGTDEGWECKPGRHSEEAVQLLWISVTALASSLVRLFSMKGERNLADPAFLVFAGVAIITFGLHIALWLTRRRARDWLYLDKRQLIRVRDGGRGDRERWTVQFADVDDAFFRGKTFFDSELKARLQGTGIVLHSTHRNRAPMEERLTELDFEKRDFTLHPQLLARLIELAEPHATTRARRTALERAQEFVHEARRETPPPIPASPP